MKRKILLILLIIVCCASLFALASCGLFDFIFGDGNPSDSPKDDDVPSVHVHVPEIKTLEKQTCTGEGEVTYWQCKDCGKCFADEKCEQEIADVSALDKGHVYVLMSDEQGHFQQCRLCLDKHSFGEHVSDKWLSNKNRHYKKCSVCSYVFDEGEHVLDKDVCSDCGYSANYVDKCSSNYGYDNLNDINAAKSEELKDFYNRLYKAAAEFHDNADAKANIVLGGQEKIYYVENLPYDGLDVNEAMAVLAAFIKDNPLFYWIDRTVHYGANGLFLGIDEAYKEPSDRIAQNEILYAEIDGYLEAVAEESSAYQIVLALHDKMIENINYAYDSQNKPETEDWAHNIIGVLTKRGAVCEGYAKTASLLMNACKVENAYVTGTSRGVGHAWNAAKMDDGKWYWFDFTWDDQPSRPSGRVYDYFCCYGTVFKDHTVSQKEIGLDYMYPVPEMSASAFKLSGDGMLASRFSDGSGCVYEVNGYRSLALIKFDGADASGLSSVFEYNGIKYRLTEISSSAFASNALKTVKIPASVKVIEGGALSDCSKLESVVFENAVGWQRIYDTVKENLSETDLKDPKKARDLVLENYRLDLLHYGKYDWVRK